MIDYTAPSLRLAITRALLREQEREQKRREAIEDAELELMKAATERLKAGRARRR